MDLRSPEARLMALLAWRTDALSDGVAAEDLPTPSDLEIVAKTSPDQLRNKEDLGRLLFLRDKFMCLQWASEIIAVVSGQFVIDPKDADELEAWEDEDEDKDEVPALVDDAPADDDAGIAGTAAESDDQDADEQQPTVDIASMHFAEFEWSGDAPPIAPQRLRAVYLDDGSIRLTWNPHSGGEMAIYRVVTNEEYVPYSPNAGLQVAVTQASGTEDRRPVNGTTRFYTVWVHVGDSLEEAAAAPPVLLAQEVVVAPPFDLRLREEEGVVTGRWTSAAGVAEVVVIRVPAGRGGGPLLDPSYRIAEATKNLRGFVDDTPGRGQRLEYRFFAAAEVGDQVVYSPPVVAQVQISADLEPVVDLTCEVLPSDQGRTYARLSWTPLGADQVDIYRTTVQPQASESSSLREAEQLAAAGLTEEFLVVQEPELEQRADGTYVSTMRVLVPANANRLFFTPVTVAGAIVRVGTSVPMTRAAIISDARIVERVTWQLLTFDWPEGAGSVGLYLTAEGQERLVEPGEPDLVLNYEDYVRHGGWHLRGLLPPAPCEVFLVPLAYQDRERVVSDPIRISYPGVIRIEYRLFGDAGPLRQRALRLGGRRILEVRADRELRSLPLVVVYRKDRLPLSVDDGEWVKVRTPTGGETTRVTLPLPDHTWERLGEFDHPRERAGYMRVFADPPQESPIPVAVIDPPVETLYRGVDIETA